MNDLISREILGDPVTVTIGKSEHSLSYPAHNIFLYRQLTGDSLFRHDNWNKIDFEANYTAWLSCLWAGLHAQQPADAQHAEPWWKAPYTRAELENLIGFSNAAALHNAMVAALTAWMPKKKESIPQEQMDPIQKTDAERVPVKTTTEISSQPGGQELATASE